MVGGDFKRDGSLWVRAGVALNQLNSRRDGSRLFQMQGN